jgi:dihydrofolate synthase/folylpolyglutamate synthase
MDLAAWLEKIQKLHPKEWDLGLDRVGEVGNRLDVLKPAPMVFLVAGTNGKGSTCEFLAGYCQALSLSYGKTTSPFFSRYNEQIVIDGKPVDDHQITSAFSEIEKVRGEISLSYFEFSALAALLIFKAQAVDVAILEIGLGGRLDAMNIVDPNVSIITRIALDHQDWLGDTRDVIAIEKAGVMRRDKDVVMVDPDPPQSLMDEVVRQGARPLQIFSNFMVKDNSLEFKEQRFELPRTKLPLPSAVAATVAFLTAGYELTQQQVTRVLESASLIGRYQKLGSGPDFILDVAHNPDAASFLADKLKSDGASQLQAVVGLYRDKDIAGVFQHLAPYVGGWHFINLPGDRGASAEHLAAVLSDTCGLTAQTYDKVSFAVDSAKSCSEPNGTVLVFGSFLTVAAVLEYLGS